MKRILIPALIAGLCTTACGGDSATGSGGAGGAGGSPSTSSQSSSSSSSSKASSGSTGGATSSSTGGPNAGGAGGAGGAQGGGGMGGSASVCGNGVVEGNEACDDGNTAAGDGCSATCAVEHGYTCTTAMPSVCSSTCGDGIVAANEGCDDGNIMAGDGCSATCTLETGYACTGEPSTCAIQGACATPIVVTDGSTFVGSNIAAFGDDLDFTDFACTDVSGSPHSSPDIVFQVDLQAGQTIVSKNFGTLDLVWQVVPTCAAGACLATFDGFPGAGEDEQTEGLVFTAATAGTYFIVVETYDAGVDVDPADTFDIRFSIPQCGNGLVETGEGCDDGNTAAGDGCSPTCAIEAGYDCSGEPSVCGPLPAASCADPIVVSSNPFELAGVNFAKYGDDADFSTGATCKAHSSSSPNGYDVVFRVDIAAGETVRLRQLGQMDGLLHILTSGQCSAGTACVASTDFGESTGITYTAGAAPETVYLVVESYGNPSADTTYDIVIDHYRCGDGVVGGSETCDDGNGTSGDGCSATCQTEAGYVCIGSPSVCSMCSDASCALGPCTGGTIVTATATGLPMSIPDDDAAGGAVVTVNVPQTGTIQRMVMTFSATHTYDSDLDIHLQGPGTSEIDVSSDNGSSGDDYTGTIFADGASSSITSGTAPFTGIYTPETPLASFAGKPVNGTWTIRVDDDSAQDTGTVDAVGLMFCVTP